MPSKPNETQTTTDGWRNMSENKWVRFKLINWKKWCKLQLL